MDQIEGNYDLIEKKNNIGSKIIKLNQNRDQICILTRAVKMDRPARPNPIWPTMDWSLSGPTKPGSLISEPKKFEPGLAHHGLVG